MKKSTFLHLRIPFSFFLLPVFLLACGIAEHHHFFNTLAAFIILHFLVYPASNSYNSYFDKDEKSIGGLKYPPKVSKELYWVALVLDALALLASCLISFEFALMILIYGCISKAYSHPVVRLKKFPIIGWLAAGGFQGYFTYLLSIMAIQDLALADTFTLKIQLPGILSSMILLGSYPMTQIYQHEEDKKRGDLTMSRILGIKGTFHFTAMAFTASTAGFTSYFMHFYGMTEAILFITFLLPVLVFFGGWYWRIRKDETLANYDNTMRLNFISSLMLNGFFLYLWIG